ncbi:hypothetical protein BHM03_00003109 [Ensete ventricosum]|nr:hypothetical protein BHM03_00003109 [Ensete ventricosum]
MIQWEFAVSTSVWDGKMEPGFRRVTPFKIREVEVDVGEDYRYTYCSAALMVFDRMRDRDVVSVTTMCAARRLSDRMPDGAWKKTMYFDPHYFTDNWIDLDVCGYYGVFCTVSPNDPSIDVRYRP